MILVKARVLTKSDKELVAAGSDLEMKQGFEKMVGDAGFEPATPWTQTKCATKLR